MAADSLADAFKSLHSAIPAAWNCLNVLPVHGLLSCDASAGHASHYHRQLVSLQLNVRKPATKFASNVCQLTEMDASVRMLQDIAIAVLRLTNLLSVACKVARLLLTQGLRLN
jgi:hypothetical protein